MPDANRCDSTSSADKCQSFLPCLEGEGHEEGGWFPARLWPVCRSLSAGQGVAASHLCGWHYFYCSILTHMHRFIPLPLSGNHCSSLLKDLALVLCMFFPDVQLVASWKIRVGCLTHPFTYIVGGLETLEERLLQVQILAAVETSGEGKLIRCALLLNNMSMFPSL